MFLFIDNCEYCDLRAAVKVHLRVSQSTNSCDYSSSYTAVNTAIYMQLFKYSCEYCSPETAVSTLYTAVADLAGTQLRVPRSVLLFTYICEYHEYYGLQKHMSTTVYIHL